MLAGRNYEPYEEVSMLVTIKGVDQAPHAGKWENGFRFLIIFTRRLTFDYIEWRAGNRSDSPTKFFLFDSSHFK